MQMANGWLFLLYKKEKSMLHSSPVENKACCSTHSEIKGGAKKKP